MRRYPSTPAFVFLIAASFSLLPLRQLTCSGSEDASFRRPPPPPPPGSSFNTVSDIGRGYRNDANKEGPTSNGSAESYGYDDMQHRQKQQQQEREELSSSSHSSRYPFEYSTESVGGPTHTQSQVDRSSSFREREQKQQTSSLPIHYDFPISDDGATETMGKGSMQRQRIDNTRDGVDDEEGMTSSARKDLVTRHWSTKRGKVQIQTVIGLVGYGSGRFFLKSLMGDSDMVQWLGCFSAVAFIVSTWFRSPIGELSRAVGLSLILVLQRTQRIRREYPTWRYVAASVGMIRGGPRDARGKPRGPRPFPPARNPWKYSPRSPRDPDFNMTFALASMAMVGSAVGGNLPFIPNWIGAIIGAAFSAFACTWQESHRGDLARTMGMRVVRVVTELWEIQADLQIIPKATVVSSQIIDKAMILDRKHRVKDRFLSLATKGYAQATRVAEQVQQQQRGAKSSEGRNERVENDRVMPRGEDDESIRGGQRGGYDRGRDEKGDRYFDGKPENGRRLMPRDKDGRDSYDFRERQGPRRRYEDDDDFDGSRRRDAYNHDKDSKDYFR
ncbi:unnamed protein product [Pseudo-nitzschia multistriata]|uniref:Uncharacterized protein n=1 Tax=Pseudo-nitzschia multistriata TaxID=183589 RepID=A0A448ZBG4_9STRA|nr:unnamed protein product [Pseudo-nitzschia multistriata]